MSSPWLMKALELPYLLRAKKVLPEADVLVTHTFWAPLLLSSQRFGKLYVHVGRYPKGQMRLYRRAERLQAPSSSVRNAILREVPGSEDSVTCQPYPLSWVQPPYRSYGERSRKVLFLGRIHPEKGVLELVRAWGRLNPTHKQNWHLRIKGPWEKKHGGAGSHYLNKVKQAARETKARIEIEEPSFNENELSKELQDARIFAYPSLAEKGETFGLAVLEAMSCGCVPLVSDLGCFTDFLENDSNALVFSRNSEDEKSLSQVLQWALENQEDLEPMSRRAYQRASLFSLEKVARGYLQDFDDMVKVP